GRAKPYTVVEMLGVVAEQFEESAIVGYFLHVWQSLAGNHIEQVKLLLEILGDPDPMGVRYVPEPKIIPCAIKLKAIELLRSAGARDYERGLCCATSDPDQPVAYQATLALMQFWQSSQGMIPQGLEPFQLLDTGLLYQLCQISACFQWHDGVATSKICEEFAEVLAEMGSVDPQTEQARYEYLASRRDAYVKQLDELSERRVRSLQPLLNAITTALNLPYVKTIAKDIDAQASYSVGMGMITLSRQVLLQDRPLTEDFMSTLIHELTHMEQDHLMICRIADDLDLKLGQHGKLLIALWTKYSDVVGYAPDHMFLLGVLRMRNDQRLTPAQRVRSERLLDSHLQTAGNNKRCRAIDTRIEHFSNV